jgi:hypothetical protein
MPEAKIGGVISTIGYLHVRYDMQELNGIYHGPWDICIFPDESGAVVFMLPRGINARIEFWTEQNGHIELELNVTIPDLDRIELDDLKKMA